MSGTPELRINAEEVEAAESEFVNPEIPPNLSWSAACTNGEEYKAVILAIYSTLKVRRAVIGGEEIDYVTTKFCNLTNASRDVIRAVHPSLNDARTTPLWEYRLLMMALKPPTLTRGVLGAIAEQLNNANVNAVLKQHFHVEATDAPDNESLPIEYIQRWVSASVKGLVYSHRKARLGYLFYMWFNKYVDAVDQLGSRVDSMLICLTDRRSVNHLAGEVGKMKEIMIQACESYVKMSDQSMIKNTYGALQEFREIADFNFNNFKQYNQTGVLWLNHVSSSMGDSFRAMSIKDVNDAVKLYTPLLREIRGFVPTTQDAAHEKAVKMKEYNIELRAEIEQFLDNTETRSLIKAKSFVKPLDFSRDNCDALRLEGVKFDEETLGATPEIMKDLYQEVFKFIADGEKEAKKQEHRERLEASEVLKTAPSITLPPLYSVSNWLSFKAAMDKIMPFHNSDIVKCTIVRKALRDKADISRCQNLTYDALVGYLNSRYNDASLLPRLIDRLLMMKPAKDNQTSLNNLNEFLAIYAQLEIHQGTDRLDNFVREKLVVLLLTSSVQVDFLDKQIEQELEWKRESPDHDDNDDDASTTFSIVSGGEFEEKRRQHFVRSMKKYSEIMRKLVATNQDQSRHFNKKSNSGVNTLMQKDRTSCPVCNSIHYGNKGNIVKTLAICPQFKAMPAKERFQVVKDNGYCKRCLSSTDDGAHDKGCQKSKDMDRKCRSCQSFTHHELLHLDEKPAGQSKNGQRNRNKNNDRRRPKRGRSQNANKSRNNNTQSNFIVEVESDDDKKTSNEVIVGVQSAIPHKDVALRMFLSACSYITVALPNNQLSVVVGLLDCGSGLSMCLNSMAKELHLKEIKRWRGTISTIHSSKEDDYPVYAVPVRDVKGQTHIVAAVGIDNIGMKTPIPVELFGRICKALHVNPNLVQNCSGPIQMILGLENQDLLSRPAEQYKTIPKSETFPGVALYTSIVSPCFIIMGAVGPALASDENVVTRMYNIQTSQCLFADPVESSTKIDADTIITSGIDSDHNHDITDVSEFFKVGDNNVDTVTMVEAITEEQLDGSGSGSNSMALLSIKKTAATLSHLDSHPIPSLLCPSCKLITTRCLSCKYLSSDVSLKDLEQHNVLKANLKTIPDPADDEKFLIYYNYVFTKPVKEIYAPQHSNAYLARKSASRLRLRLIKEKLLDSFHAEMVKSIGHGHFGYIEGELAKDFESLQALNYINFNYVVKPSSLSQSCRPVSDSTAYHKNGCLNSNLVAGVQSINNPLVITWGFLWGPVAWSCDYSRAYRSVVTSPISNSLRRFFWYRDQHKEESMVEMCLLRLNYGDTCSSAVLEEGIRSYIAPLCKIGKAREILTSRRYIDDTLASFDTIQEMQEVSEDIRRASSRANFTVKYMLYSGSKPVDEDKTPYTNVLAMCWRFQEDLLVCSTSFNVFPKRRGAPSGPDINEKIVMSTPITKTVACRLAGQSFGYTQSQLLPITMGLRIGFSKVSQMTTEWHEDITEGHPEFAAEYRRMLLSLVDLPAKVDPVPRAICPAGHRPYRLVASSDGSSVSAAACLHVITRNDRGEFKSTNVCSRGKIVKDSVPIAEMIGASISTTMLTEYIEATPQLQDIPLDVIMVTDSLCLASTMNPRKIHKSVKVRNTIYLIHKQLADLVAKFPLIKVRFCHIVSKLNASDGSTKMVRDPVAIVNSSLWKYGPDCYLDAGWPSDNIVFLRADADDSVTFKEPVAMQHSEFDVQCVSCHGHRDFCGSTKHICAHCCGSDNNCYKAGAHMDQDQEEPRDPGHQVDDEYPVEELDNPQLTLGYQEYCKVTINSSSLIKVLGVVTILCRVATYIKKKATLNGGRFTTLFPNSRPTAAELRRSWRIILRSTQKYFKPRNVSSWFPFCDRNGIMRARTRYKDSVHAGNIFQVTSPPLVSHADHRVSTLIARHHHIKKVNNKLFPLHLPVNVTHGNMRGSDYCVELTSMKRFLKKYVSNCITCIKLTTTPLKASLGSPRWLRYIQEKMIVHRVVSLDPIGPYYYQNPNTRGPPRKCWVLCVSCMLSCSTYCYVMTGNSRADVYLAMSTHVSRFTVPKIIYMDNGTSVSLDQSHPEWVRTFGDVNIDVIRIGTEEFHANFIESKIKILKRMLKSALQSRSSSNLPVMTIPELQNFFEVLANLLNSRPLFCTPDGQLMITPNHATKGFLSIDDMTKDPLTGHFDTEIDRLQNQMEALTRRLNVGCKLFMQCMKDTFLADTTHHRILRKQSATPHRGDIVMVSRRQELHLGIVEKSEGQFSWIRRKKANLYVTERINFRKIFLIHRPYLSSKPPGQNDTIVEVRNSRGYVQQHIRPGAGSNSNVVLIPHSFDDILLPEVQAFYIIEEDGITVLNETAVSQF